MKAERIRAQVLDLLKWQQPLSVRSIQAWIMYKDKNLGRHRVSLELLNMENEGVLTIGPGHEVTLK